jgi:hypothetical protein
MDARARATGRWNAFVVSGEADAHSGSKSVTTARMVDRQRHAPAADSAAFHAGIQPLEET